MDLLRDAFGGIAFGDSVAEVTRKLDGLYDELERIDVKRPVFPLAVRKETHLIAVGLPGVGLEEAAFTFGDDALVLVEARGGQLADLLFALEEETFAEGDYEFHPRARVVSLEQENAAWFLSEAAMHPNLFLWANPHLPSVADLEAPYEPSAERPAVLEFGARLEELLPRLKTASFRTSRQDIATPWLPTKPRVQTQVNAFGIPYAGFPRKIEAVFGDGELQLAWILTAKPEEERVRRALVEAYGPPDLVSKSWEVFDGGRVGLRKDKPEVLMLADGLVPLYRERMRE